MTHFELCVVILAALWTGLNLYRAIFNPKATETAVLYKTTDDGENLTLQLNLTADMSEQEKFNRIQSAFKFGEQRLKFVDERFKQVLMDERAKQEPGSKLQSV